MKIMGELSGHEFEEAMGDIFRNAGYENVRVSRKTGDEGRDILMEKVVNGQRQAVVVECKHQKRVGRPVIQKLHSAITTYDFSGPKKGIIATTGKMTNQARDYIKKIQSQGDGTIIEIIDGHDLRELADGGRINIYSGRVEITCNETLPPIEPSGDVGTPVRGAFKSIDNFDMKNLSNVESSVTFVPVIRVDTRIEAEFSTSVGVIHRISERDPVLLQADDKQPTLADSHIQNLFVNQVPSPISLDRPQISNAFDASATAPFKKTKTEYRDWSTDHLRQKYTSTVKYTGDNDVTYTKECVPDESDITIRSMTPVYVPKVSSRTTIQQYDYTLDYYAAGAEREFIDNDIERCVHCGEDKWWANSFTYCSNCGSISCWHHICTERLEQEPICVGCAVTNRFAFQKKYFYTEQNREEFQDIYDQMAFHEKALENKPALACIVLVLVYIIVMVI